MEISSQILAIVIIGIAFFISALLMLYWAATSGHLSNLDKVARMIFNEEEPEGVETDFFPGSKPNPISKNN